MYCSDKLVFCIIVVMVCVSGKCDSSITRHVKEVPITQFENFNHGVETESSEFVSLFEILKTIKLRDGGRVNEDPEMKNEVVRRVTRQTHYDTKSLYPQLPTAPYQQQPYPTRNPAHQQWPSSGQYNNVQPGYPTYTPSSYQTTPYNSWNRQPSYNAHGSYNNYNPNDKYQQQINQTSRPGYPYRNPVLPGASNFNQYTPSGYPQPNTYSGYPPNSNHRHNNFTVNPVQAPTYYQSGNSSSSYTPINPYGNKYPNSTYSSTVSSSFLNRTGYGSSPYPTKPGNNHYQNNVNITYGNNRYGGSNFNGVHQTWPYNNHTSNNINSNLPQNYSSQGQGAVSYNNNNFHLNQGTYPSSNQYGSNYYPNNQYNGTSTYRLAETYTPSIPNQPPHNGYPPNNNFYYPTNMNNTYHDATKASPNRFSY